MSRTPLGYFELPLTQEERDMIAVPFLGNKNKNIQISLYKTLLEKVNESIRAVYGEYFSIPLLAKIGDDFYSILNWWSFENSKEYKTKEFFNRESFNISIVNGQIIPSKGLELLSKGLYPYTFALITQEDLEYNLVDFANNNIELFSQPNSKKVNAGYVEINKMLTQYIDRQIESSHIGRKCILDHSEFISELIKTIKGQTTNEFSIFNDEGACSSIRPYEQETKDE